MSKIKNIFSILVLILLIGGLYIYGKNKDMSSVGDKPSGEPGGEVSMAGFKVPEGFTLSIFAENIPGARVMAMDGSGDIWVTQTREGKVSIIDNKTRGVTTVLQNLNKPHGLTIDNEYLYIAEETKISRASLAARNVLTKIADLPAGGGGHYTRTLLWGPDDRIYVSIGSTCNVCIEKDERSAAIYSMKKDGSDFKKVASGLRNSVFMATNPVDGKIFATEMGRDLLGDDVPPDEINIIEQGKNYGWPICYGKNIHDTQFDKNIYIRNPCMEPFETPSFVDLQAHSAPLGLAFVPEDATGWGEEYWYNLLVAYHGSWNRSEPTGYKIVRIKLNAKGQYLGTEDFITGWLTPEGVKGRPVDIKVMPGGTAYISDDSSGVVYKLSKN